MKRLGKARTALRLVPGVAPSPAELDAQIVDAAVKLHRALDGAEIDAPGPLCEALRALRDAVERSGR